MFLKIIRISIYLLIFSLCITCTSPIENEPIKEYHDSYTPILPGMIKQYLKYSDNSYQNITTIDFVKREDGLDILSFAASISIYPDSESIHHQFVRDGYLYACTKLKSEESKNPFGEVKIAQTFPKNGDMWERTTDTTTVQFFVHEIYEVKTPAGIFNNVMNLKSYYTHSQDSVNVYYAKGFGHIGTIMGSDTMLINYFRDDVKEYGEYVQF